MNYTEEELHHKYITYEKKINELLYKIICITDTVLKEQLEEEYIELENEFNTIKIQLSQLKDLIYLEIFNNMVFDLYNFYQSQYNNAEDLFSAIEYNNNIKVKNYLVKNRFKNIYYNNNVERRYLINIAQYLKCKIIIKDMENNTLDILNNIDTSITLSIVLYCPILKYNTILPSTFQTNLYLYKNL